MYPEITESLNKLIETYEFLYRTEFNHLDHLHEMWEHTKLPIEECPYYPIWELSHHAIQNFEAFVKSILDESLNGSSFRQELEKHLDFQILASQDTHYTKKLLAL